MAAYGLGRAPYPGVGGYSGECVLFVRLGGTRSLFTRLRLKMREEKKHNIAQTFRNELNDNFRRESWHDAAAFQHALMSLLDNVNQNPQF